MTSSDIMSSVIRTSQMKVSVLVYWMLKTVRSYMVFIKNYSQIEMTCFWSNFELSKNSIRYTCLKVGCIFPIATWSEICLCRIETTTIGKTHPTLVWSSSILPILAEKTFTLEAFTFTHFRSVSIPKNNSLQNNIVETCIFSVSFWIMT